MQPQDTARGWSRLIYGCVLRTFRTVDAMSDMGLAALIFYDWKAQLCTWDSQNYCDLYLGLLVAVATAAGTDYLISVLFVFWQAAKHGSIHIALHTLSLACEVCILCGTVILQQHRPPAADGVSQNSTMWFLILSGSFNLVSFVMNCVGIDMAGFLGAAAVRGITGSWRAPIAPSESAPSARTCLSAPPHMDSMQGPVLEGYPLTSLVSVGSLTQQALGSRAAAAGALPLHTP